MKSTPCYLCNAPHSDIAVQYKLSALRHGESIWRDYQTDVLSFCMDCWSAVQRGDYQTDFVRVLPTQIKR